MVFTLLIFLFFVGFSIYYYARNNILINDIFTHICKIWSTYALSPQKVQNERNRRKWLNFEKEKTVQQSINPKVHPLNFINFYEYFAGWPSILCVFISFGSFLHRRRRCRRRCDLRNGLNVREAKTMRKHKTITFFLSFFLASCMGPSVWFICVCAMCAKIKKTPFNISFKWRIKSYCCIVIIISQWVCCDAHRSICHPFFISRHSNLIRAQSLPFV